MFSTRLSRAACRATTSQSSTTAVAAISTSAPHCTARPASHQRRHSSSKASSCPPDSTSKSAPAAKASREEQQSRPPVSAPKASSKSSKSRAKAGYKRQGQSIEAKKAVEPVDQFAGLPSVPSLQGLDKADLSLSTFFSLHRPISLTTGVPPPSTPDSFASLFADRKVQDSWANGNSAERRPEDVIYTLQNTVNSLESGARNAEDEGVRWEIIHESPSNNDQIKHLDGAPRMKSLDELVAQFKPFRTPPPPQPFLDANEQQGQAAQKRITVSSRGRPKKKTFTATITVTESTDEDGQKTYTASSSPIVRQPDVTEQTQPNRSMREPAKQPSAYSSTRRWYSGSNGRRLPEAPRVKIEAPMPSVPAAGFRPLEQRKYYMISVKRQRKLKMKKHKYKKLMKRTRNLRRRQDRA